MDRGDSPIILTPEWITFIVETLGFKRAKVDFLEENLCIASVEDFLDVYAPDKENGLRKHMFLEQFPIAPDQKEEGKADPDTNTDNCKICGEER